MPQWISDEYGKWHSRKERVALKNLSGRTIKVKGEDIKSGEDYIYEGPDRAALYELWKTDNSGTTKTLGKDFRGTQEFRKLIRELGFKTAEEYFEFVGYNPEEAKQRYEQEIAKPTKHDISKKAEILNIPGGGIDTAGQQEPRYGGFGEMPKD
jgi:hypothetical protein